MKSEATTPRRVPWRRRRAHVVEQLAQLDLRWAQAAVCAICVPLSSTASTSASTASSFVYWSHTRSRLAISCLVPSPLRSNSLNFGASPPPPASAARPSPPRSSPPSPPPPRRPRTAGEAALRHRERRAARTAVVAVHVVRAHLGLRRVAVRRPRQLLGVALDHRPRPARRFHRTAVEEADALLLASANFAGGGDPARRTARVTNGARSEKDGGRRQFGCRETCRRCWSRRSSQQPRRRDDCPDRPWTQEPEMREHGFPRPAAADEELVPPPAADGRRRGDGARRQDGRRSLAQYFLSSRFRSCTATFAGAPRQRSSRRAAPLRAPRARRRFARSTCGPFAMDVERKRLDRHRPRSG